MDPRHPELAITRIDELMQQYKEVLDKMRTCNVSSRLGEFEREGSLVVQEICLVAPRLHEAMMQVSRTRRGAIVAGIVKEETVEKQKLTPEEEEDFAKLLVILDNAKKQFEGKNARNKETGKVYTNLYFSTIKPFDTDHPGYGILISMDNGEETLSFGNEKVADFLSDYEPVEKTKKKATRKKKTAKKAEE